MSWIPHERRPTHIDVGQYSPLETTVKRSFTDGSPSGTTPLWMQRVEAMPLPLDKVLALGGRDCCDDATTFV